MCRETAVSQERPYAFHTELMEPGCSQERYAQDGCVLTSSVGEYKIPFSIEAKQGEEQNFLEEIKDI